mmetsp:Transcript_2977/g.4073  ORF Transcript_2977/g.4073 Transcript_2977/m.4073 type:complete len:86 (-) Transcript_2977:210-467(-)
MSSRNHLNSHLKINFGSYHLSPSLSYYSFLFAAHHHFYQCRRSSSITSILSLIQIALLSLPSSSCSHWASKNHLHSLQTALTFSS